MRNIFFIRQILIAAIFVFTSVVAQASVKVTAIEVTGNQRVEKSTVREYLGFEVGDKLDEVVKSDAVKSLYATSLFEDISIRQNGGKITVNVQETPLISRVLFVGNTKVKGSMLADEVYTSAGESLRRSRLASDVEKIKEIYKRTGRFTVGVSARVEPQENNRVKVIFDIKEGPKTGVQKILFSGNGNYTDSELRSIIMTKESRWFRFLETNDTYDPDRVEMDKYLLRQFYNSVGYADFSVLSVTADLDTTREGFRITYSVEEGEKYVFEHSIAIKDIRVKINKLSEDIQTEMSENEIELKKAEALLIRQRKDLSEEEFDEKVAEFNRKVSKIQKLLQSRKAALEQAHTDSISAVHSTTISIISELSKKYGFNLVLPSTQVLFVESDLNITLEVITNLNKRLTSIDVQYNPKEM